MSEETPSQAAASPPEGPKMQLNEKGRELEIEFLSEDSCCSCHISAPCAYCTHPGHPLNLEGDPDCWEPEPALCKAASDGALAAAMLEQQEHESARHSYQGLKFENTALQVPKVCEKAAPVDGYQPCCLPFGHTGSHQYDPKKEPSILDCPGAPNDKPYGFCYVCGNMAAYYGIDAAHGEFLCKDDFETRAEAWKTQFRPIEAVSIPPLELVGSHEPAEVAIDGAEKTNPALAPKVGVIYWRCPRCSRHGSVDRHEDLDRHSPHTYDVIMHVLHGRALAEDKEQCGFFGDFLRSETPFSDTENKAQVPPLNLPRRMCRRCTVFFQPETEKEDVCDTCFKARVGGQSLLPKAVVRAAEDISIPLPSTHPYDATIELYVERIGRLQKRLDTALKMQRQQSLLIRELETINDRLRAQLRKPQTAEAPPVRICDGPGAKIIGDSPPIDPKGCAVSLFVIASAIGAVCWLFSRL